MELFYSRDISSGATLLDGEESSHCVRVLRHKAGDVIHIVDGCGCLYECEICTPDPHGVVVRVISRREGYGSHPYHLHMAVAPPKNIDRFEWFVEKATEIGVDEITPLFGDYSERKVFKAERVQRLMVAAAKQSHKGAIPVLHEAVTVREFVKASGGTVKCICYCDDVSWLGVEKLPLTRVLSDGRSDRCTGSGLPAGRSVAVGSGLPDVTIMIGPEGDFSRSEVEAAVSAGFRPVSLGESRLRIETAALTATAAVYLKNI